jgi:hypothetical protein
MTLHPNYFAISFCLEFAELGYVTTPICMVQAAYVLLKGEKVPPG